MDSEQGIERKGIDEHELQAVKYQLKKEGNGDLTIMKTILQDKEGLIYNPFKVVESDYLFLLMYIN